SVITADRESALYFEELIGHTANYKSAANWLMGTVRSYLNENNIAITKFGIKPANLASLIALVDEGKVNNSVAAQKLFPAMLNEPTKSPAQLAQEHNLLITADTGDVQQFINDAIAKYPDKVIEYRK